MLCRSEAELGVRGRQPRLAVVVESRLLASDEEPTPSPGVPQCSARAGEKDQRGQLPSSLRSSPAGNNPPPARREPESYPDTGGRQVSRISIVKLQIEVF